MTNRDQSMTHFEGTQYRKSAKSCFLFFAICCKKKVMKGKEGKGTNIMVLVRMPNPKRGGHSTSISSL